MELAISIGMFILVLLLIEEGIYLANAVIRPEVRQAGSRLKVLSISPAEAQAVDIVKKRTLSKLPWLNRALLKFPGTRKIERMLEQADASYPLGFFLLLSVMLALTGLIFLRLLKANDPLALGGAIISGMLPLFYLVRRKKKRMGKMERQLPDALDLIARSMRAGHAFTGGIKMVAEEFGEPIASEFGKTLNEINFGVGVPEALKNLAKRVDAGDMKFFVTAVIIQRETGGNLAEILDNLSLLIRKRFKLQGKIRALSADGRLSATIITAMPFFIFGTLSLFGPNYIGFLTHDPTGHVLLAVAFLLMVSGVLLMKKIISFRV